MTNRYSVLFLSGAIVTGLAAFTEWSEAGTGIAQVIFFLFLTLGVVSLFLEHGHHHDHETP